MIEVIETGGITVLFHLGLVIAVSGIWLHTAFQLVSGTRKGRPTDRVYYALVLIAMSAIWTSTLFFLGAALAEKDKFFGSTVHHMTWAVVVLCLGLAEVFRGKAIRAHRNKERREWPFLNRALDHRHNDPLTREQKPASGLTLLIGVFFVLAGSLTLGYYALNATTTLLALSSDWQAVLLALVGLLS
ncbi:hypothetical protein [Asticcacaulis sp. YBE204]|uniref:hypothetical protein n=1 Tax=Asticcacaulis sp. YBE204 TaxID=1282363 RepID=UPI0003C3C94E|nr:hypothetical protein [Asticcacaulis sp. YBE204]ESQ81111.1 hypothetical protein AEYBE204_01915 [Asticcacaulis sp. YBE204]